VRGGKGDRDRVTMLPGAVKADLVRHLEVVKCGADKVHVAEVFGRASSRDGDRATLSGRAASPWLSSSVYI
jgi:hypothetical protein